MLNIMKAITYKLISQVKNIFFLKLLRVRGEEENLNLLELKSSALSWMLEWQNTDDKFNINRGMVTQASGALLPVVCTGCMCISFSDWKLSHVPLSCWLRLYRRKGAVVVATLRLRILRHRDLPAMLASQMVMLRHLSFSWDCLCMCLF